MEAKDIIENAIKGAREKGRGKIISRDDIYNAIFKAGRKDVVEWIEEHSRDTYVRAYGERTMDEAGWEAQKKIWLK